MTINYIDAFRASVRSVYLKVYPNCWAYAGNTRWPVTTTSAISPISTRKAKTGTGAQEGRCKTFPRV